MYLSVNACIRALHGSYIILYNFDTLVRKGVKLKFLRKEKEIEHKLGCSRKIGEVQGFKDI